jgi:hypothetical protein
MSFQGGDEGPFWMTDQEHADNKYDRETGAKKRHELTINELHQELLDVAGTQQAQEIYLCNKQQRREEYH